jgi:hypothetical protein
LNKWKKLDFSLHLLNFFRGHNVTFFSGFPADFDIDGLDEVAPQNLVQFINNFTDWDLLGELNFILLLKLYQLFVVFTQVDA